jgi:hypothetical protein
MTSTDLDVVQKLQEVTGMGKIYGPTTNPKKPDHSPTWQWSVYGKDKALVLMEMVYPLMCSRRQAKIDEIRETVAVV